MIANVLAGLVAPKNPGARCRVPVDENTRAERPSRCPPGGVRPQRSTAPRGARPEPHPRQHRGFLSRLGTRRWRGSPPRTSAPSRANLLGSDTDLPAAGAPAASACPGPDSCGARHHVSGVLRRSGLPMRRLAGAGRAPAPSGGTGGRAALARSALCAAAGLLLVVAGLLGVSVAAQAQTTSTDATLSGGRRGRGSRRAA